MALGTSFGDNVLQVAYFLRHDMIKSLASIYLDLPSDIVFIFSSTLFSTAASIALSVDVYPSLIYSF